jgi:hypothetical protein
MATVEVVGSRDLYVTTRCRPTVSMMKGYETTFQRSIFLTGAPIGPCWQLFLILMP